LFEANTQIGGEENWDYLPYGPFAKLTEYTSWLKTIEAHADPCFFAILRKSDGSAIGVASFLRIKPNEGSIEKRLQINVLTASVLPEWCRLRGLIPSLSTIITLIVSNVSMIPRVTDRSTGTKCASV